MGCVDKFAPTLRGRIDGARVNLMARASLACSVQRVADFVMVIVFDQVQVLTNLKPSGKNRYKQE